MDAMASYVPTSNSPGSMPDVRLQTNTQDELAKKIGSKVMELPEPSMSGRPTSRASSLSPLSTSSSPHTGITIEHRMISDMRNQLESQAVENRRLRQQIETSTTTRQTYSLTGYNSAITPPPAIGTAHRSLSESHISMHPSVSETVESILARGSRRSPIQNLSLNSSESATEVLLRKQLSDAQTEITLLNQRLRQSESNSDEQKAQFRSAVEDLQARLNDTIVGRDSVLELRKRESEGQEKMISQLQQSLQELDTANRQHEKELLESRHTIDSLQHSAASSGTALQQILSLLSSSSSDEVTATSPLPRLSPSGSDREAGRTAPPSRVVRLVEEGLRGRQARIRELETVATETRRELAETKREADEKIRSMITCTENRDKLLNLNEDQSKQLEAMSERAANARQQAAGLHAQLAELQDQSIKQMSVKTMELTTLQTQYEALQKQSEEERQQQLQKIDELRCELDAYNSNMNAAREEISSLQLKMADANLALQSHKETVASLQDQLQAGQERVGELRSQEGQRLTSIQRELEARSLEVRHLEEMLTTQKEEAHRQLQQLVFEVQCEERNKAVDKRSELLAEIESVKAENSKLSLETLKKNADFEQSNQSRDRLASVLEETSCRLESVQNDNENLTKQLEEKSNVVEILTHDRDHYEQMCEERKHELDSSNSFLKKLQAQVAERESQYDEIIQQKIGLTQVIETKERTDADARQEKENLIRLLDEKTKEVEEVKGLKDDLNRKLKLREKRMKSLEMEVKALTDAVGNKTSEVENVIEGKAGILVELKSCQEKVISVSAEKEALETRCTELEASQDKSTSQHRLRIQALEHDLQLTLEALRATKSADTRDKSNGQHRLRILALEHDLQLTLEALRATKSADTRAVDVADSLQHELISMRSQLDSFRSRQHSLEEMLAASNKEKTLLAAEKELLEDQVSQLRIHMEQLQHRLGSLADKRSSQREVVSKLQAALEKAALKHTDAQRVIEEQEQSIARLTLKHQLQIKALERSLATKKLAFKKSAFDHPALSSEKQKHTFVEKIQRSDNSAALSKMRSMPSGGERSSAGVVSAHFLQSSSVQGMEGMSGRNYISPVPVVILNPTANQVDSPITNQERCRSPAPEHNVSAELKDLLEEVKSVFTANMAALKTANSGYQRTETHASLDKAKSSFGENNSADTRSQVAGMTRLRGQDDHILLVRDTQSAPVLDLPSSATHDEMESPLLSSSPYKIDDSCETKDESPRNQFSSTPKDKHVHTKRDLELNAPSSPVTNLLGLHNGVHSDPTLHRINGTAARTGVKDHKVKHGVNRTTKQSVNGNAKYSANGSTRHGVKGTTKYSVSAATVTRSYGVSGTTNHGVKGESVTRSSGAKGPTRHSDNGARTGTSVTGTRGANVKTSLNGAAHLIQGVNGATSSKHEKCSSVNGMAGKLIEDDASDFSVPLSIQVPDPRNYADKFGGDTASKKRGKSRTVQTMNRRNRDAPGVGLEDVNATPELIISDDDCSSITTVTSASTDISPSTSNPGPTSSLLSLRERLANLSQMGVQLQRGNKEMAGMIKRQDTKLKLCRHEERQAQQIINSK